MAQAISVTVRVIEGPPLDPVEFADWLASIFNTSDSTPFPETYIRVILNGSDS
jgi:hypothetical protein